MEYLRTEGSSWIIACNIDFPVVLFSLKAKKLTFHFEWYMLLITLFALTKKVDKF